MRVGIVGCGKAKAAAPAPARDLYTGALFRKSLAHAERTCDRVYVASALHGLLELDQEVAPYERTLKVYGLSDRLAWGGRVVSAIRVQGAVTLVVYAGADYEQPLKRAALYRGWAVETPLHGLQIGQRLQWLTEAAS